MLREAAAVLLSETAEEITIDLGGLRFIDAAGLGEIVRIRATTLIAAGRPRLNVKAAERDAVRAEDNAADSLDFAAWAIDVAEADVLDAVDARAWADARAAASPSTS